MKTSEILIAAKELIAVPERWTKHSGARNCYGNTVFSWDDDAVCFCLIGAINRVTKIKYLSIEEQIGILSCLEMHTGQEVDAFNDAPETTHADVLAVMDKAIEAAKKEEENGTVY